MNWLLLRTQAIGEAGDNNTALKYDLQRMRTQIREVYHKKFVWNQTKLGIDGSIQMKKKYIIFLFNQL